MDIKAQGERESLDKIKRSRGSKVKRVGKAQSTDEGMVVIRVRDKKMGSMLDRILQFYYEK